VPALSPNHPVFAQVPTQFFSPFPSSDAYASPKFSAIADSSEGVLAAAQAKAWQDALRICMKAVATSGLSGGFREQWLEEIAIPEEGWGGATVWDGLFANVSFRASTKEDDFLRDMRSAAFGKAVDFISANTGPYGAIFKAAVVIGTYFLTLATKDQTVRLITVPWQRYSRDTDEDLINRFLPAKTSGVDWTPLFSPPLDARVGFKLAFTDEGELTRAYGAWGSGDKPSPDYTDGWGFMPGTQQMADVLQLVDTRTKAYEREPNDIVTNIGTFYPSVSQYLTAAENFINRMGSADMFKIQPAKLEQDWEAYYAAYFGDGFDQLKSLKSAGHSEQNVRSIRLLAKALWQGIYRRDRDGQTFFPAFVPDSPIMSENIASFTDVGLFYEGQHPHGEWPTTTFMPVSQGIIAPALKILRQRQMSALAHSLACAYVRPRAVGNLPAFAAFRDPGPPEPGLPHYNDPGVNTWGKQLIARCDAMRARFLVHLDRYKTRTADVKEIDPPFGQKLQESKRLAPEFPIKGRGPFDPLDPDAPEPEASPGPQGDAPGTLVATEAKRPWWRTRETKIAAGMLAGAGVLGYTGHRLHETGR
jgi:hypothetical protein